MVEKEISVQLREYEIPMHLASQLALNLRNNFVQINQQLQHCDASRILPGVNSLNEALVLISRADFRKIFVETMVYFHQRYHVHMKHPSVDKKRLSLLLSKISSWVDFLESNNIKSLLDKILSNSCIMQSYNHRKHTQLADLIYTNSVLLSWEQMNLADQHQHLHWISQQLAPVKSLVGFVINVLKNECAHKSYETTNDGFYHHTLDTQDKLFYVSLKLAGLSKNIYPEVSLVNQKLLIYFHELIVVDSKLNSTPYKTNLTFSMMYS